MSERPVIRTVFGWALVQTDAPRSYDYGYSVEVNLSGDPLSPRVDAWWIRVVAVPLEHFDMQVGRYVSGLYMVRRLDMALYASAVGDLPMGVG